MGLPGAGAPEQTKHKDVAGALKLNRVYPINLSYRQGGGRSKASTQRDSSPVLRAGGTEVHMSHPASLEFQKASGAVGLNKKLAASRQRPGAHQSTQMSASTLPHDFRKYQSMAAGAGSPFDASLSPDLPLRHRQANDVAGTTIGERSNQANISGTNRSKQTLAVNSLAFIQGQGKGESPVNVHRSGHRNQVLLSKSPNIFAQNQQSNQHLEAAAMSQPNVKPDSLHRLFDSTVGLGASSGSKALAAQAYSAGKNQNEAHRSGVFGLSGRAKNLNEQSGAMVGTASGVGLGALYADEHHQDVASMNMSHSLAAQLAAQHNQSASLDPPQKLTTRQKKFTILNPEKKLDKYVRDLESQNVTTLAKFMSNKKYFHKFYQLQDMDRVSLMMPDGKLNDKAFDLISNSKEF